MNVTRRWFMRVQKPFHKSSAPHCLTSYSGQGPGKRIDTKCAFRPFTEKGNEVAAVFLPLSSTRVLIGERDSTIWDQHVVKRQAIRCSLEYFITNEPSAENATLAKEIGADATMLTRAELEELAAQSFFSLDQPNANAARR